MIGAGLILMISSLSLAVLAVNLFRRINGACREGTCVLLQGAPATPYLEALANCLKQQLDESLLPAAGAAGLQQIELRYREHQDPYRNVADLLADIARKARIERNIPFDALFKATYQLSYTLRLPLDRLNPCLDALIVAMQGANPSQPIAKVQKVAPGELVDAKTMVALNYGPRVVYPLGVVTYDSQGKVLTRARVICS